jgi:hypothetical protein
MLAIIGCNQLIIARLIADVAVIAPTAAAIAAEGELKATQSIPRVTFLMADRLGIGFFGCPENPRKY